MSRFVYALLFCGLLLFSGCDNDKSGGAEAAKTVAAEKAQAAAVATKRDMETADALVQKWIDKLQPRQDGEFVKHEGLTEVDPWSNYIRVTHEKHSSSETLEVRSAGPDSVFNTPDDLTRTRERAVSSSFAFLGGWGSWIALWVLLGLIALVISESRRRGYNNSLQAPQADDPNTVYRSHKRQRGFVESSLLVAFGGVALLFTGLSWLCGCGSGTSAAASAAANADPNRRRGWLDGCDCAPCDCCVACDPTCGACGSGGCDAPDCNGCGDCGGCDCGGCDCGGCDCGGCDC